MDIKKLKDTYNKIAEDYFRNHAQDDMDDDYIEYFSQQLFPKAKVLDLGCGPGIETAKLLKKDFKVYGFDLSEGFLKIACERSPEATFSQGDMLCGLPYENEFFDGIFAKASLLHVPKDKLEDVLKEILRVLKKNGILHIAVKKGKGEREVHQSDYGYEYERFFSYWQSEELKNFFNKYNLITLKEDEWTNPKKKTVWLKLLIKKQ